MVLAPLKVVTAPGNLNYYVKIVDWENHTPKVVFFVRSGETALVKVPTGTYEMRYASGKTWYGEEYLFGPETGYSRLDEQFEFKIEGHEVSGFTVELIKQVSGNLKETPIIPSEF